MGFGVLRFAFLLTVSVIFSGSAYATWVVAPETCKETCSILDALNIALTNNPDTKANDELVLKARAEADAAWKNVYFPSPNLAYGYKRTFGNGVLNGEVVSDNGFNRSGGIEISANIYHGGIDKLKAQATSIEADRANEQYNGNYKFNENGKAAVAESTVNSYSNVISARSKMAFYKSEVANAMTVFMDYANSSLGTADDKTRVVAYQRSINDSMRNFQDAYDREVISFLYSVTISLPIQLDNFPRAIESLLIPQTPELAINLGMQKNSSILMRKYALQIEDIKRQIAEKRRIETMIDVGAGFNSGVYSSLGTNETNHDWTVGITFRVIFNSDAPEMISAQEHAYTSAEDRSKSELRKMQTDLKIDYINLAASERQVADYLSNLDLARHDLQDQIDKVNSNKKIDMQFALSTVDQLIGSFESLTRSYKEVLYNRYDILSISGTLFDLAGIPQASKPKSDIVIIQH